MSEVVMGPQGAAGVPGRARAARVGAGVAVLAMALVVYGAYGDSKADDSQRSAVPVLLVVAAALAAVVYGWLAPVAQRAVARDSVAGRRWAIVLSAVSVLLLAVFWTGGPLIVGGAAAIVGHDGRSRSRGSRAFAAAWWLGLFAAAASVSVTILGNTVGGH